MEGGRASNPLGNRKVDGQDIAYDFDFDSLTKKSKMKPTFAKTFNFWKSKDIIRHNPVIGNTSGPISKLRQKNEGTMDLVGMEGNK